MPKNYCTATRVSLCAWQPILAQPQPLPAPSKENILRPKNSLQPQISQDDEFTSSSEFSRVSDNCEVITLNENFFEGLSGLQFLDSGLPIYLVRSEIPLSVNDYSLSSRRSASHSKSDVSHGHPDSGQYVSEHSSLPFRCHSIDHGKHPLALKIVVELSLDSFQKSLIFESKRHDICINVFYNGELAGSRVVQSDISRDPLASERLVHEFSGRQFGTQFEIPWMLDSSHTREESGNLRDYNNVQRWSRIQRMLRTEADRWMLDDLGEVHPMSEYLIALSDLEIPGDIESSKSTDQSRMGIIDVVIVVGKAKRGARPFSHSQPHRYLSTQRIGTGRRKVQAQDDFQVLQERARGRPLTVRKGYVVIDASAELKTGFFTSASGVRTRGSSSKAQEDISSNVQTPTPSHPLNSSHRSRPTISTIRASRPSSRQRSQITSGSGSIPTPRTRHALRVSKSETQKTQRPSVIPSVTTRISKSKSGPNKKLLFAMRPQNRRRKDANGDWYVPPLSPTWVAKFDPESLLQQQTEEKDRAEVPAAEEERPTSRNCTDQPVMPRQRLWFSIYKNLSGHITARRLLQDMEVDTPSSSSHNGMRMDLIEEDRMDLTSVTAEPQNLNMPSNKAKDGNIAIDDETQEGIPGALAKSENGAIASGNIIFNQTDPMSIEDGIQNLHTVDSLSTARPPPVTQYLSCMTLPIRQSNTPQPEFNEGFQNMSYPPGQTDKTQHETTGSFSGITAEGIGKQAYPIKFLTPVSSQQEPLFWPTEYQSEISGKNKTSAYSESWACTHAHPVPFTIDAQPATGDRPQDANTHFGSLQASHPAIEVTPPRALLQPLPPDHPAPSGAHTQPNSPRTWLFTEPAFPPFRTVPDVARGIAQDPKDPRITDAWMPNSICRNSVLTYASDQAWGGYLLQTPSGQVCRKVREEKEMAFRASGILMGVRFVLGG